ncbi:MAG: glutathione S-transferase family protein [Amylibacter sp.]|nr:glutathione S-transferase family protein [Amylibacter sp.]
MGQLIDGKWSDEWYDTKKSDGKFVRSTAAFRDWITADGSTGYKPESGRYHLYVSAACPWAHRTLIFRKLKQLEDHISVDFVHPDMIDDGWTFEKEGVAQGDSLFNTAFARDIYLRAKPDITTRVTVPILWDRKTDTIVSTESSEIIRMFNNAFNGLTGNTDDYYPENLRTQIDTINARIYSNVNNGVYKAGFATTQSAYDNAVQNLFETLDWLENHLSKNRYLIGDHLTEADWRLFTTLLRFDSVYVQHFKCNRNRIVDFPNLWAYTRELYQWDGVAGTVNFDHIVRHYHYSHVTINPHRIIPINPVIDWTKPHGRG